MRKLIVLVLTVFLLLAGCTIGDAKTNSGYSKYSYEFLGTFDTVIQFLGYAESMEQFDSWAREGQARFTELHRLFDIYNNYEGLNNIKTINDYAGIQPVKVQQEIIDLILFAKEWYDKTGGQVNIAMGPVLEIWHEYRTRGKNNPDEAELPSMAELQAAVLHTDINKVIVDEENMTVYLPDPEMSLDVGAIAKGFASEIVAREFKQKGLESMIISSGGNVRLIGKPLDGIRSKWGVAVQDPDGNPHNPQDPPLDIIFATDQSVVTSGDYQRYYEVGGRIYHHIIDPQTLMPANYYRAVTVMYEDSGVADFMSTTLFLLPFDESKALAEKIQGLEALWVFPDGRIEVTEGMKKTLRDLGGATSS